MPLLTLLTLGQSIAFIDCIEFDPILVLSHILCDAGLKPTGTLREDFDLSHFLEFALFFLLMTYF